VNTSQHNLLAVEQTDDYFCKEKTDGIASRDFESLDPLEILCYEEDAEQFESFTAEEVYLCRKD